MRCNIAARQIQLYIDGRLPIQQLPELEDHIATCPSCRVEMEMLEEAVHSLKTYEFRMVQEPENLTTQIMQRIALNPAQDSEATFSLLRPSLAETIAIICLATVACLGSILSQASIRERLPIANGHDGLSMAFLTIIHHFTSVNSDTLTWALWIVGTILGVCITLFLAGNEVRSEWFKALPYPSLWERMAGR